MGTIASKESCPLERGFRPIRRPPRRPPDQSIQNRHDAHEQLLNGTNQSFETG